MLLFNFRFIETLALTWKDINFDKREIDINKTVNIINQDVIVGPPKTENGYRTLGISDTVYDLLKLVRLEQKRRKHALKDRYKHPELVLLRMMADISIVTTLIIVLLQ